MYERSIFASIPSAPHNLTLVHFLQWIILLYPSSGKVFNRRDDAMHFKDQRLYWCCLDLKKVALLLNIGLTPLLIEACDIIACDEVILIDEFSRERQL